MMTDLVKIKVGESIIPSIPFLWYREEEFTCPIDYISKLSIEKVKELYNYNTESIPYLLIQRHLKDNANIYICLHSLFYYELHKTQEIIDNMLEIPNSFNFNMMFNVKIIPLNDAEINEVNRGLKINEFTIGHVFIHNCAFSPAGCLHFKVNNDRKKNEFICEIKCEQLNINISCLFVLFNDLKGTNLDELIKSEINKIEI